MHGCPGLSRDCPESVQKPAASPKPAAKVDSRTLNTTSNRPILKAGSQGADVVELQGMLKLLGYYNGAVNGAYEQSTAAAVSQFQKAAGLSADGIVGSDTWNRLLPPSPRITPSPSTATSGSSSSMNPVETFPSPSPSKAEPTNSSKMPTNSASPSTKQPVAAGRSDRPQPINLRRRPSRLSGWGCKVQPSLGCKSACEHWAI